jgi:ribonuclease Z
MSLASLAPRARVAAAPRRPRPARAAASGDDDVGRPRASSGSSRGPRCRASARARASSASASSPGVALDSLRKLKVAELKAELEARGRSTAGLKADLVERLARVVASGEDASEPAAPEPAAPEPAAERAAEPAVQRTMFNSRPASSSSASDAIVVDGDTNFSGMEVVFLGTSSGSPSFTRNVSSYALRLTDEIWLFDCGEATQHQLMRSKLRYTKITRIFITHMHGDHIFGLPGLICALSGARAELRCVLCKKCSPTAFFGFNSSRSRLLSTDR